MKRTKMLRATAALVVLAGAVALTGCSVASAQQKSDPSASSVKSSVSDPSKLKVAYFVSAANNTYLKASIDEAKKYAAEHKFSIDIFDGQFSAQVQYDQMQTALTSGKYNAFAVMSNDGNLECKFLTKDAPAAHVLVTLINQAICGRGPNAGDALWQPGTVTIAAGQTLDGYNAWVDDVMKTNPNGGNIALITGPALSTNTVSFHTAAKKFAANPKFHVVADQQTDYTTGQAFSAAQTIIQSHPDLNMIMSNFSGMTRGVVQATLGTKVSLYDFGGDQWSLDNVKSGVLTSTVMMLPRTEVSDALSGLVNTVEGKPVPHFIDFMKSKTLPGTPFVTKNNVDKFTAEY